MLENDEKTSLFLFDVLSRFPSSGHRLSFLPTLALLPWDIGGPDESWPNVLTAVY